MKVPIIGQPSQQQQVNGSIEIDATGQIVIRFVQGIVQLAVPMSLESAKGFVASINQAIQQVEAMRGPATLTNGRATH